MVNGKQMHDADCAPDQVSSSVMFQQVAIRHWQLA
jgi:hypothetical protein